MGRWAYMWLILWLILTIQTYFPIWQVPTVGKCLFTHVPPTPGIAGLSSRWWTPRVWLDLYTIESLMVSDSWWLISSSAQAETGTWSLDIFLWLHMWEMPQCVCLSMIKPLRSSRQLSVIVITVISSISIRICSSSGSNHGRGQMLQILKTALASFLSFQTSNLQKNIFIKYLFIFPRKGKCSTERTEKAIHLSTI